MDSIRSPALEHDPARWAPLCRQRSCGTRKTRPGSIHYEAVPL